MIDRTYCTAADYARLTGYDRTTVADWIKAGIINAKKRKKKGSHYRIYKKYFHSKFIQSLIKADFKHETVWTSVELHVLRGNINKPIGALMKLLPHRTKTAIKVKRTRERRKMKGPQGSFLCNNIVIVNLKNNA